MRTAPDCSEVSDFDIILYDLSQNAFKMCMVALETVLLKRTPFGFYQIKNVVPQ